MQIFKLSEDLQWINQQPTGYGHHIPAKYPASGFTEKHLGKELIEGRDFELKYDSHNDFGHPGTLPPMVAKPLPESQVGQSPESKEPQGDTIEYEKLIAFLSTDCGLMGYRWDEGLTGVDRIISFLKYKFGQPTQQGQSPRL